MNQIQSPITAYLNKVKKLFRKKDFQSSYLVQSQLRETQKVQFQSQIAEESKQVHNTKRNNKLLLGIEFDEEIRSEEDLVQYIRNNQYYLMLHYMNPEQKSEFQQVFKNVNNVDGRNIGSLIGFTILGVLGFIALGFTVIGVIAGGILGLILGRYAGKRLKRGLHRNSNNFVEFDIFEIKLRCYIKWAKIHSIKYKWDINQTRFFLEKMLFEVNNIDCLNLQIKPALHYRQFSSNQQKQIREILAKIVTFLKKPQVTAALYLSFLLCQEYLEVLKVMPHDNNPIRPNLEICLLQGIDNVLKPFITLMNDFKQKNGNLLRLKYKIDQFLISQEIIQINYEFPDPQMSLDFIKLFAEKMKVPVKTKNLQIYLQEKNYKDLENIGQLICQERKSRKRQQEKFIQISREETEAWEIKEQFEEPQINYELLKENQINLIIPCISENINEIPCQKQYSIKNSSLQSEIPKNQFDQHPNLNQNSNKNSSSHGFKVSIKEHPNNAIIVEILSQQKEKESENKQDQNEKMIQMKDLIYDQFTLDKFELFISILNEPERNWENVAKKDNIFIFKTMKPGNASVFVKGYAFLEGITKEVAFYAIYDPVYRASWDKILEGFKLVERENDLSDIIFYYARPPFPVISPREWLQKRVVRHNYPAENQISIVFFSVEHESQKVMRGHIRAETDGSGFVFEDSPNGCKISFVSNNDIKGKLPKALVNYASAKAPFTWFANLRKACNKLQSLK